MWVAMCTRALSFEHGQYTCSAFSLDITLAFVIDILLKSDKAISAPMLLGDRIDDSREAVVSDVGSAVPQVGLQWFKDNILPSLPVGLDLLPIIKELEGREIITSEGVLAMFETTPANAKAHEDNVFKPWESIAAQIGLAAKARLNAEPKVVFQYNPHRVSTSLRRNDKTRPDGYSIYKDHFCYREMRASWEQIVVPGEFKKVKNAENTNDVRNFTYLSTYCLLLYPSAHTQEHREDSLVFPPHYARGSSSSLRRWIHNRGHRDAPMVW